MAGVLRGISAKAEISASFNVDTVVEKIMDAAAKGPGR